jgi:ketosteroid isomerase-like protein
VAIDVQERHRIEDLLARWCWLMDGGNGDDWAALWTDDGVFTGIPEAARGPEQLAKLPVEFHKMGGGKFRHTMSNVALEQGDSPDEVVASVYSTLTNWNEGGAMIGFAKVRFTFAKVGGVWKIAAQHAESLG